MLKIAGSCMKRPQMTRKFALDSQMYKGNISLGNSNGRDD